MKKEKRLYTKFLTICLCLGILVGFCGSSTVSWAETPEGSLTEVVKNPQEESLTEVVKDPPEELKEGVAIASQTEAQADASEKSLEIDLKNAVTVVIRGTTLSVSKGNKALTVDKWAKKGVEYDGKTLTLDKGVFILSGDLNGQLVVKAGKKSETVLVLNGVTVTNPEDAALSCSKTASLTLVLQEGSENVFTSGTEVEINEDCINLTKESSGGAIYSKAETTITGTGSLQIKGYLNNGIHVTKSLTIEDGTIDVTAVHHGVKVKDTFYGNGGTLTIHSGGDGVKAEGIADDPEEAAAEAEAAAETTEAAVPQEDTGSIVINDGTIIIESYDDGMQALCDLTVNGGLMDITAIGTYNLKGAYRKTKDKTFSAKGLKSDGTITIDGGTTSIKAYSDALHCTGLMTIKDGVLSLYCGDDGLHSDVQIDFYGGITNISNSYEGIEANQINIYDGTISLFAWDDGMNANGGSGFGSGRNRSNTPREMPNLNIYGGDLYVNSDGDGIDSNGNLTVYGGTVVVDGPAGSMNGALDAGTENGGTLMIYGGTVFAGGTSSMAETFSSKSEQPSFHVLLSVGYKAESEITVQGSDGEELFHHIPASSGTSIVFSSPELEADGIYTLQVDDNSYEIVMTGISTKISLRRK